MRKSLCIAHCIEKISITTCILGQTVNAEVTKIVREQLQLAIGEEKSSLERGNAHCIYKENKS